MTKYISIVSLLCFLCSLHAQAVSMKQSIDASVSHENTNSDTAVASNDDALSLLKRPSYESANTSLSLSTQILWFESSEDTAQISVEEEVPAKPGFNWKACCIAGVIAVAIVGFVMLASMGQWLATH